MNQADRRPLLVVVPAYNEAETIGNIVRRVQAAIDPMEVIVVQLKGAGGK